LQVERGHRAHQDAFFAVAGLRVAGFFGAAFFVGVGMGSV
jgi:hypothetical protein